MSNDACLEYIYHSWWILILAFMDPFGGLLILQEYMQCRTTRRFFAEVNARLHLGWSHAERESIRNAKHLKKVASILFNKTPIPIRSYPLRDETADKRKLSDCGDFVTPKYAAHCKQMTSVRLCICAFFYGSVYKCVRVLCVGVQSSKAG